MISLPPGCTISYEVTIVLNKLTSEFLEWYKSIGGTVYEEEDPVRYGKMKTFVRFSTGRPSHTMAGSDQIIIRFRAEDAGVALMILMMYPNLIISHNMQEVERMKELANA